MPVTTIDLDDAADYFGTTLERAIRKGAIKGLYSAALRMVNKIQTETIPQTIPEPSARGHYKAGWRADHDSDSAWYENVLPHAAFIEHGVRGGNVKVGTALINGLTEWVNMKGIASGPAAVRVAWAIAHRMASSVTITRGGSQQIRSGGSSGIFAGGAGLKIMEKANKDLPKILEEEIEREVERALR